MCKYTKLRAIDSISLNIGETHATRFVCLETTVGIRDLDLSLIHLPTYYSKRQLYEIFCFQSRYKIQCLSDSSYIPVSEYTLRENDDGVDGHLALWPVGSRTKEVCSWARFLQIWKSYLPSLKIKPLH